MCFSDTPILLSGLKISIMFSGLLGERHILDSADFNEISSKVNTDERKPLYNVCRRYCTVWFSKYGYKLVSILHYSHVAISYIFKKNLYQYNMFYYRYMIISYVYFLRDRLS